MRRDRKFEEGEVSTQLPTAEVPASRIVVEEVHAPDPRVTLPDQMTQPFNPGNKIVCGDSASVLERFPEGSVACAVTSPPYWNLVDYGYAEQIGGGLYEDYRKALLRVWKQVERVLQPNGKFCLNVPLMPLRKAVSTEHFGASHTRMILDLPGDLKADILSQTGLRYYSLYVWEKQTTEKMFGSYPYPPNLLERNYIEFILVFVKPGKPPKMDKRVKEAAKLAQDEWMDLTKQIWWIYPENVKRKDGHPSPFPENLPNRLIRMYTFPAVDGVYEGDLVLDPLAGWGTTCVAAKRQGRRYCGIDLSVKFCNEAVERLDGVEIEMGTLPATKPVK
jgi:DNA modification methylase